LWIELETITVIIYVYIYIDAMHALSFTKVQVLKAQVLAKFIRSDKTSAVTVLGSFTWALVKNARVNMLENPKMPSKRGIQATSRRSKIKWGDLAITMGGWGAVDTKMPPSKS
jgi:hypothetical protein